MAAQRRDLNRENTIRMIEDAFRQIYEKEGLDGVSVSRICELCGIARSTFYLYFDDKRSLLEHVESYLEAQCRTLSDNYARITDPHRFEEMAPAVIRHIRENLKWYAALLGPNGDPQFAFKWRQQLQIAFKGQIDSSAFSAQEVHLRSEVFAAALMGLFYHIVLEDPDLSEKDLSGYMTGILDYFLTR